MHNLIRNPEGKTSERRSIGSYDTIPVVLHVESNNEFKTSTSQAVKLLVPATDCEIYKQIEEKIFVLCVYSAEDCSY